MVIFKNINYWLFVFLIFGLSCSEDSQDFFSNDNANGQGGSMARFTLVNNFLYVVDNSNLSTYNVTQAENPIFVNTQGLDFGIETIYPYEDFLLIGSTTGMYIYEIGSNGVPSFLSEFEHVESCDPVVTDGTYAYVTLRSGSICWGSVNRMEILNIENPRNPQLVKTIEMSNPKGLALNGNYLFVCDGNEGIVVFDKTNGANPLQIGAIDGFSANDVIVRDNRLMAVCPDGLRQFDISDINNITNISYYPVNF